MENMENINNKKHYSNISDNKEFHKTNNNILENHNLKLNHETKILRKKQISIKYKYIFIPLILLLLFQFQLLNISLVKLIYIWKKNFLILLNHLIMQKNF